MSVNVTELEASMTHIVDHPEEWDQTQWVCGSAACFAGRGLLNHGYRVFYNAAEDRHMASKDGVLTDVASAAAKLYGITGMDAKILFSSINTLDTLQGMVKDLANGEELDKHWAISVHLNEEGDLRGYYYKRLPEGQTQIRWEGVQ